MVEKDVSEHVDVMVDCETYSLRPNAAILSIGAVVFDRNWPSPDRSASFYRVIKLDGQVEVYGRDVDRGVVDWWSQQPSEAQEHLLRNPEAVVLPHALMAFSAFCARYEVDTIWSMGAISDNVWLGSAFDACSLRFPFHYRRQLCLRTLAEVAEVERSQANTHHALEDAIAQATWAQACFKQLVSGKIW
jgi:DNA polymerase III epsilon subunit-like protein